jgi:hypothetical protein
MSFAKSSDRNAESKTYGRTVPFLKASSKEEQRTLTGDALGDAHCDEMDNVVVVVDDDADWIPPNVSPVDARRRLIRWLSFVCLVITTAALVPFVSFVRCWMIPVLVVPITVCFGS